MLLDEANEDNDFKSALVCLHNVVLMRSQPTQTLSKMKRQVLELLNPIFILILFSCFPFAISRSLARGDSLSVEKRSDFITSPDNTFTCGFHNLGTNAYWFAIWYTNSRDRTVIWMANRDRPVNSKGSKMTIRKDGAMVLTDVDGTVVWQTNTTSSDVSEAVLLSTGNLVLRNSEHHILWQSFDLPTDTLLPTQNLTKNNRLTSAIRKDSYESGYFNLNFASDNVLRLISDNPDTSTPYWPNPDFDIYRNGRTNYNSSRVAALDNMGRFLSSDQWHFNTSDMGYGTKRRLTLDYDGNLRVYSLVNSTGLWDITWQAIAQPCSVKGICGRNALCVYAPEPKCTCPTGFEIEDSTDWSKGCKAMFNRTLLNSRDVKFLEIQHTDFYGFDLNTTYTVTLETCQNMCLEDFRCIAFSYRLLGQGVCYVKSELFNGIATPDFPGSIYIKLPSTLQAPTPNVFHVPGSITCKSNEETVIVHSYDFNYRRVRWTYVFSFAGGLGAMEMIFIILCWWFLLRKHGVPASVEAGYRMVSSQFRRFDYSELKKATKNFEDELGRGGSGAVYKGVLTDERVVAVKRLIGDFHYAQDEYFAEISTLGKINHMNLVRIWGFCSTKRQRILVYEYFENSSLDRHIFGEKFLTWEQRYVIALGTAKGLTYLHHECLEWVIHCDVKPENILLDGEFRPKIADFGLAKLSQRGGTGSEFTRIRGTKGYMAPEWALNHPITGKVDVYGFGVVVLEMVKGVKVCNWTGEDWDHNESGLASFVRICKVKMRSGELDWVNEIVDERLAGKFDKKQAAALIRTAISCVEEDRNKRPTMASVVQTLLECEDE